MATVQLATRLALRARLREAATDRRPGPSVPSPSVLPTLFFASRRLLGTVLLLLAALMIFTLVLLPVGLPLALLGVALLAAPGAA